MKALTSVLIANDSGDLGSVLGFRNLRLGPHERMLSGAVRLAPRSWFLIWVEVTITESSSPHDANMYGQRAGGGILPPGAQPSLNSPPLQLVRFPSRRLALSCLPPLSPVAHKFTFSQMEEISSPLDLLSGGTDYRSCLVSLILGTLARDENQILGDANE